MKEEVVKEMKLTKIGSDYIPITEESLEDERFLKLPRVHLIKFNFHKPTKEKVDRVISLYPKTNRFVIEKDIRIYNFILRSTSKKYYVENSRGMGLITFFRRNNKVLLNLVKLTDEERRFILFSLADVLRNVEVIILKERDFRNHMEVFETWNGNVVIFDEDYENYMI